MVFALPCFHCFHDVFRNCIREDIGMQNYQSALNLAGSISAGLARKFA